MGQEDYGQEDAAGQIFLPANIPALQSINMFARAE
jgi:hypothetical protein